jgi:hypothetical protein
LWEVEWEREVRREKRRRENPVVRDGEFCYRVFSSSKATSDLDDEYGLVDEKRTTTGTTLGRSFSLSTF